MEGGSQSHADQIAQGLLFPDIPVRIKYKHNGCKLTDLVQSQIEEKTVQELKKTGKPFLILVNSQKPYKEETQNLVQDLKKKYQAGVLSVNCEQLRKEDVNRILEKILYEFPIVQMEFYVPKWVEMLPAEHYLKENLLDGVRELMNKMKYVKDAAKDTLPFSSAASWCKA